jgi:8-oxo-dGTP pyrophosphatase MutT (NUDIX family)
MSWKPDLTVAAIIEREGHFLLVEERIRGRRVFNQPAGHVEEGETLLAAVIRETQEETAWRFIPEYFLGIYLWRAPRSGHSTLRLAFTGSVTEHNPQQALDPPVLSTHWLTRAEIQSRQAALRSPLVTRCIEDYIGGRRLPLAAAYSSL